MITTAIIGGSGLTQIESINIIETKFYHTPYGDPSSACVFGKLNDQQVIFLARHGDPHTLAPHKINYRANLWALKEAGAEQIIAIAAVGGITSAMKPASIAIPEQIIDYSYGREHTYLAEDAAPVQHIDFSYPYHEALRQKLMNSAQSLNLNVQQRGVYGCTQGPRLETAAEILRMQRDGCDLVGMTGMPEAALARELKIPYICCAVIANWAAGKSTGEITMPEIILNLKQGMNNVEQLLQHFLGNTSTGHN